MSEEFDPYRRWLGIAPHEQPPHHYRLLGIALFEDDPDVIEGAADRQMAHVRTFQAGKYGALSQRILNELAAAKVVLLSPEKKAAYDQQLRDQTEVPAPPGLQAPPAAPPSPAPPAPRVPDVSLPPLAVPPAPLPAPAPPQVRPAAVTPVARDSAAPPDPSIPRGTAVNVPAAPMAAKVPQIPVVSKSRGVAARARARSKSNLVPMLLGLVGLGAALVGVLVYVATQSSEEPSQATASGSQSKSPAPQTPSPTNNTATKNTAERPPQDQAPQPEPSIPPSNKPEPPRAEVLRNALQKARAALKSRELSQARIELNEAEFVLAGNESPEAAEFARVEKLYEYVDEFWRGVRAGIYEKSQAGDVIPGRDGPDVEFLKRAGEQVTYKTNKAPDETTCNINDLPGPVAMTFARRGLGSQPKSDLCLAAFLWIDRGDSAARDQAKAFWVAAAEQGLKDTELAAELGLDAAFIASIESKPADQEEIEPLPKIKLDPPATTPDGAATTGQTLPSQEELLAAKKVLAERFGMELARARNKPDQAELLLPQLLEAIKNEPDLALKLVMIDEALELAVTALRVDALALIDTKGTTWTGVDVLREKQLTLAKFRPVAGPALETVTQAAEDLASTAAEEERLDVAIAALNIAIRHATRNKDRDPRDLQKQLRELEDRHETAQRATAARTKLETEPQNAVAHQDLGRYLCYYRNAWDEGLIHLAQGEMEEEAQLAEDDLNQPADPQTQAALGERWYQLAKKKVGPARNAALLRAKQWLDQALPNLTDDARTQAENRLRDIAKESIAGGT